MTTQRSFKRLVRARMDKTGESYTTARAHLLAPPPGEPELAGVPGLLTTDEKIRARTGRGWEAWFDLLDEWGAVDRTHREIARWVAEQLDVAPLAWNVQTITSSYELVRGLREVGEHPDGFRVSVSRTIAVPVEQLYDAVVDGSVRDRWLPDGKLHERTATSPKAAHFDWADGPTRVHVTFTSKGPGKSTVSVSHERLADAAERDRMKAFWRERLTALNRELER